jgi:hypothetical protein
MRRSMHDAQVGIPLTDGTEYRSLDFCFGVFPRLTECHMDYCYGCKCVNTRKNTPELNNIYGLWSLFLRQVQRGRWKVQQSAKCHDRRFCEAFKIYSEYIIACIRRLVQVRVLRNLRSNHKSRFHKSILLLCYIDELQ